jgi:hypothetical protein
VCVILYAGLQPAGLRSVCPVRLPVSALGRVVVSSVSIRIRPVPSNYWVFVGRSAGRKSERPRFAAGHEAPILPGNRDRVVHPALQRGQRTHTEWGFDSVVQAEIHFLSEK